MILGSVVVTSKLKDWLEQNRYSLTLDVVEKGCNGNTLVYRLIQRSILEKLSTVAYSERLMHLVNEGLNVEADYLDTPLFQGVHLNVKAHSCGCGKSFSA